MAKSGGAKLNRSETVTVRLDPKLNYFTELAARSQRRTKSSFIEWAVAEALKSVNLPEALVYDDDIGSMRSPTINEKSFDLWHVDEPDRIAALAIHAPALLTHDEQLIWKLVRENGNLWKGRHDTFGEWRWEVKEGGLVLERLREHWETFKKVANQELPLDALPKWQKFKKVDDLDDDIPF